MDCGYYSIAGGNKEIGYCPDDFKDVRALDTDTRAADTGMAVGKLPDGTVVNEFKDIANKMGMKYKLNYDIKVDNNFARNILGESIKNKSSYYILNKDMGYDDNNLKVGHAVVVNRVEILRHFKKLNKYKIYIHYADPMGSKDYISFKNSSHMTLHRFSK